MKRSFIYRTLAFVLSCTMALTGCANSYDSSSSTVSSTAQTTTVTVEIPSNSDNELEKLDIESLDDPDLSRYIEDALYEEHVTNIDSDDYYIENIETSYISKEYLDELEYNSKQNVFFGYTLAELDEQFQGEKYVFTLNENGETVVQPFEKYDDTYIKALKNFAIGTGVILVCVTVSALTAGAPAVSLIFAASAKGGAISALSGGTLSGGVSGVLTYIKTGDIEEALKSAASNGSEAYKFGAISGSVLSGVGKAGQLYRATKNGLTMNQVAMIQKESKYPLDVIKEFSSMEQFEVCQKAGLATKMVHGKTALVRNIDLNFVDDATGLTNLERMKKGLAALDPSGKAYELHHIGQKADSTLAILTQEEHRLGDSYKIWHEIVDKSDIDRTAFDKVRQAFWQDLAESLV